ncbi:UDP-N-acetylglucosamine 1-carboxyvinyltransferase [Clostridium botulinum]|uniref:UDP-N-acetylglucosamine 1-carboxyvinyltransferase n=1 Tax=Clostridium botulinum (strain Hall / ATCC 3502 / NCTC 13319 / Type A) TaxID=441771 RepID=A5HY55_CLOBH|nr:UDP-N-acetylglucosamine 1-carboxyvinyltransferase [Clostridium botulinum]ABS36456.1 UDP-N-acetylglucosamine 1-carboxyvinyltransferase [Clostridium botulinum A str. Hall]APQ74908.1 UDP-N-acetylglucosamine 1-carboxyvinyltransferase [Clostridium botulinum]APQ95399.1 UDP-N-acetylglucosamine 1-carboxyvinyltransferase [Clostridium botulinum]AUM86323.1 UDP-N-acetylglucosamine 1-carboxyvinyltransferase [Clostridium botulinum]AUN09138.1 UDP-N-acetylglucosamine 1-carboxyvinyltransferase [Clostridium 
MDKIVVNGGSQLKGDVNISTAKNSVLPIIAGSILSGNKCVIDNAPMLEDVFVIGEILKSISAKVNIDEVNNRVIIDSKPVDNLEPDSDLVKKMRASFLLMGPMMSRFGRFKISLPGGCNIGTRPIDLHLKGFTALGAKVNIGHGYVEAVADKLIGNKIYLDFPSVGATENIMMASVMAEGETVIENAAEEPEIEDLGRFLNSIGANIIGAGTDTVRIIGVNELKGTTHRPIYDRIEAGTFMIAAAITKSRIKINGVIEEHLKPIIAKLTEMGVDIKIKGETAIVDGRKILNPVDIKTMPYPGFPTDMQAQMMALLATIKGTSIITETIFENRFMHVSEMKRMGADVKIDGRSAVIEGVNKLTGTEVKATDLRAGAALILCALAAEGKTEITDVYHIDRGYVKIEEKLNKLGANIRRVH